MSDIQQKDIDEVYCSSCGAIIKKEAEICPKCGVRQRPAPSDGTGISAGVKNGLVYFADAMKKYIVFSGRARRAEFFGFIVCAYAILVIIGLISNNFLFGDYRLVSIMSLAFFVPSISVWWRRMHDVGKPGGYCFIPIYNIILVVQKGDRGTNQYGPDPKGGING
jgi:uncharacterized membrane protein YhaH (DUF805 family)